ncbi:hypothetical protein TU94_02355 [Streptomyces cyaneogriseus subsp. noncyanogenus]|uniref:Gram-positive cocci surface proteins LPxTG domain-containing protein n=1 Tax=Streptomyces cyaneogriseus subsp. noncyanogenus TaxID=477245 RepID=A0A0C5FXM4_9ACTN|nr:hypothetical protein [Streptomyces cyaneogriseus]AJP00544.1 hypothetical protein TU94_02355 [Streptomyces cyaneogriseus subsp. noncyanogenus]
MRSARMLLAAGAASAALALGAPGAFASGSDHEDTSYSQEHDKGHDKEGAEYGKDNGDENSKEYGKDNGDENSKEHGKDNGDENDKEYGKDNGRDHGKDDSYDSPRGGMRTGGGALAAVNEGDWGSGRDSGQHDSGSQKDSDRSSGYKDSEHGGGKDSEHGSGSWNGGHEKPRGGMHTGGGALAAPSVTAGGMAALAVAGAGLYAVRRRKTAESAG